MLSHCKWHKPLRIESIRMMMTIFKKFHTLHRISIGWSWLKLVFDRYAVVEMFFLLSFLKFPHFCRWFFFTWWKELRIQKNATTCSKHNWMPVFLQLICFDEIWPEKLWIIFSPIRSIHCVYCVSLLWATAIVLLFAQNALSAYVLNVEIFRFSKWRILTIGANTNGV